MSRHYHEVECPSCKELLDRVRCDKDTCTTPIVADAPFTSSDGCIAKRAWCPECRGDVYYDLGNRVRWEYVVL